MYSMLQSCFACSAYDDILLAFLSTSFSFINPIWKAAMCFNPFLFPYMVTLDNRYGVLSKNFVDKNKSFKGMQSTFSYRYMYLIS